MFTDFCFVYMSAVIGVFAALPCSSVIEARLDSAAKKNTDMRYE